METLLETVAQALRFIPLVLAFYLPALVGVVIWHEKVPGYRVRAALVFVLGFGFVVGVQILFGSASALQAVATIGLSLVLIAISLALATLTVYKLAD